MIEVFLPKKDFTIVETQQAADLVVPYRESLNEQKTIVHDFLKSETGIEPEWGIWTGVRPLRYFKQHGREYFKRELLVSDEKILLLEEIKNIQESQFGPPKKGAVAVYINIPFCPTRCLYCSFTSSQAKDSDIERYLAALAEEICFVGQELRERGLFTETIYIGGGTPTTLDADALDYLCGLISEEVLSEETVEWTLEAGRPDTISEAKLDVAIKHGVNRLSINPQTLKEDTLDIVGRKHTNEDFHRSFELARKLDGFAINCDLIAGLPGEDEEDFIRSLEGVIKLEPENITVHNLAVKRASRLLEEDEDFHHKSRQVPQEMMKHGMLKLREAGYKPYYIYRQKHMRGDGENLGFTKGNHSCLYNIRVMDEKQTLVALGAGGISKKYLPETDQVKRVANVMDYDIYIDRIEEMIKRKAENLF